jgi:two-component system sensor histidine kinase KdpD
MRQARILAAEKLSAAARQVQSVALHDMIIALLLPVLAAFIAEGLRQVFGVRHVSFVFMTSVLLAGAYLGTVPAFAAALAAFAIYNFFLVDPFLTLQLASADDFVTLMLFLVAALVTGGLAGRLREAAQTAQHRLVATEALFHASRTIANAMQIDEIFVAVALSASRALDTSVLVLAPRAGLWSVVASQLKPSAPPIDVEALRQHAESNFGPVRFGPWLVAPVRSGRTLMGALAAQITPMRREESEPMLHSLAQLAAVAIEREVLLSEMTEARALSQTERLRASLLSSISHDFRTPLAAIMASSTSLIDYSDRLQDAAKSELLLSIRDEAERMNHFVANLLDMGRVESGAIAPRSINMDLRDLVEDALTRVSKRAAAAGVVLRCKGGPAQVRADPVLLEQALINVLDNAIAFSPEGATVSVEVKNSVQPAVTVTDAGPGVEPDVLPRLFDKFFRDPRHANGRKGTGLGLSISKGFVEAMGGSISVESPVSSGRGARFSILLTSPEEAS